MASIEWSNAITKLQNASNNVQELKEQKVNQDIKDKLISIMDNIVDSKIMLSKLHDEYNNILNEKRDLQTSLKYYEDWDKEKNNYTLFELSSDIYVYQKVNSSKDTSPKYCAHCFGNKKLSIIQMNRSDISGIYYDCPNCKNTIRINPSKPNSSTSTISIRR